MKQIGWSGPVRFRMFSAAASLSMSWVYLRDYLQIELLGAKANNETERWSNEGIYVRRRNTHLNIQLYRVGLRMSADLGMLGIWCVLVEYIWLRLAMMKCNGNGRLYCSLVRIGEVRSLVWCFERIWLWLRVASGSEVVLRWFWETF